MSNKPSEAKTEAVPGGVAQLYSRAHSPGSRYCGFSASRRQVQEQFRKRIERESTEQSSGEPADVSVLSGTEYAASQLRAGAGERAGLPRLSLAGLASRYALQPVSASAVEHPVVLPPGFAQRPPSTVVFSLASRVGKTCLTATLGRALSALGEQVLLADTSPAGSLPLYFGSRVCKPGVTRTFFPSPFSPPDLVRGENRTPVRLLNLEAERFPRLESGQDWLLGKLTQESRGFSRIIIDVATAGQEVRRLLPLRPVILVPVMPDVEEVAGLPSVESLLGRPGSEGEGAEVFFVLNQFSMSAHHQGLRETLQGRLGSRLLPFELSSSPAVSEALADGMTVMESAPDAATAQDFRNLAAWLRRTAPAAVPTGLGN